MDLKSLSSAYSSMGQYMKLTPVQKVNPGSQGGDNSGAKVGKSGPPPPAKDTVRISQRGQALAKQTDRIDQDGDVDGTSGVEQTSEIQSANVQNATASSSSVQISQRVQTLISQVSGAEQTISGAGQTNGIKNNAGQKSDANQADNQAGENSSVEYDQPKRLPLDVYA